MLPGICVMRALSQKECDLEKQLPIASCARSTLKSSQRTLSEEAEIAGGQRRLVSGYAFLKAGQVLKVFAHQRISPRFKLAQHGCL
jgi:hypothetical protein